MSATASEERVPATQRERQRVETRERLFQAAVAEFRRVGFAEAQIPAIAEAAGVVRGTFYFHFPSKEHVLLELVERREAELCGRLAALRGTGAPLEAVLGALLDASEPNPGEEASPALAREIVAMQLRTPLGPEQERRQPAAFLELCGLLAELVDRGQLRTDIEVESLAAMVVTSIFGMAVARGASPGDDRHPTRDQLLAVLLPGLRPVARSPASV